MNRPMSKRERERRRKSEKEGEKTRPSRLVGKMIDLGRFGLRIGGWSSFVEDEIFEMRTAGYIQMRFSRPIVRDSMNTTHTRGVRLR